MEMELYKHSFKVQDKPLASLSVYNTGKQRCEGGYCWGPGVRDHYLIHYVISGKGTFTVHGETYPLSACDMFLARPGETITYRADDSDPWTYCWVGFNGLDAAPLLAQMDFTRDMPVARAKDEETAQTLLLDIFKAHGAKPFEAARMTGKLYAFLSWLLEFSQNQARGKRQSGEEHTERACAFIAHNIASPISVEDVAGHVGVCRSRLFRAFQETMGLSPEQYLTQFRMRQACQLLKTTALPVKAVAYSVGFEDPLYFSRRFKSVIGCSPTEYAGQADNPS